MGSRTWAFHKARYWIPKIQDGGDPPSWKSTWRHFSPVGIWIKFCTCRLRWYGRNWNRLWLVEFQYGGRLGEFNHPRTMCYIAGWKNSIRHIENRFSPYFIFCSPASGGFRIVFVFGTLVKSKRTQWLLTLECYTVCVMTWWCLLQFQQ